ncbi:MAG: DNA repair protein RecN [Bacteroidaceae bacterium]|nr:DNA repair protein RecN [Bacteroidaceae bacterium]
MLQHLYIQNYALIEELDIDIEQGFSVITGETGAGKSILLGAIGLLIGQRADIKSIRQGAQKCIIEATFNICNYNLKDLFDEIDIEYDPTECIIRRELSANGKSRAFINDTPAGVNALKTLGDHLIDIHSQHQNLLLGKEDFQLNVLDLLAHNQEDKEKYASLYAAYKDTKKALEDAKEASEKVQSEQDYLTFQLEQLTEANLQEGEDEELEKEQQTLEHAEEIKTALFQAKDILNADGNSVIQAIRTAQNRLEGIAHVFTEASELASRLESCRIELKDVASEVEGEAEDIEYNPARQAFVEERLSLIYELERKHHVESVEQLINLTQELQEKLDGINHSEENILKLEAKLKELENKTMEQALRLSKQRSKAATEVEKAMCEKLIPLGIANVQFKVDIEKRDTFDATGIDKVTYLFSANKNGALQPISQVASGGEIARVMLSLKALISSAASLPTIIFDEIDTGVSGHIAERMALIMKEMGEEHGRQVISITHLPQIAAMGKNHYRVYKEDNDDATNSHIVQLSVEERIEEIAKMMSGSTLTEAALSNAKTLLSIS